MAKLKFFERESIIWQCRSVTATEKLVLLALNQYADAEREICSPSTKKLAEACCLTRATVSKSLATLVEKGMIEKTSRYDGNAQISNMYFVDFIKISGCGNE